jgi:hypothetical protein
MLAVATAVIMLMGPSVIGYLPGTSHRALLMCGAADHPASASLSVMVVGALIFVLGFDLVKEV